MICRIQPEHKAPVETLRRIACAFTAKCLPEIRNRSDYAIMDVCRSRCGITCLTKCCNLLSRFYEIQKLCVDRIKMKIFMDPPLRPKNINAVAGFARHFLGVDHKTTSLRDYRSADLSKNIHTGMGTSRLPSRPWPVPEALMIIVGRRTTWHCLPFRDKITGSNDNCCDNECDF